MATRSNLRWGAYDINELFNENYEVVHAGYFNDHVLEKPYRLVPLDALSDLVNEGKVGAVDDKLYSMPACTTVSKRCAEVGTEMAETMKQSGKVDGVILTSTWGTSTRCGATMARSIEKMGIPVVQITAIPSVAQMLSVSRVVVGKAVPYPTGDIQLDEEKEKALRKKYVLKALELLHTDVEEATVAYIDS